MSSTERAPAAVLILTILYLNAPIYLYYWVPLILPKYLYFVCAALCIPGLIRFALGRSIYTPAIASWSIVYSFVYIMHISLIGFTNERQYSLVMTDFQSILLTLIISISFSSVSSEKLKIAIPVITIIACALIIIDFVVPGKFYQLVTTEEVALGLQSTGVGGRGAALYFNPNRAAEAVLFMLILSIAWTRGLLSVFLLILSGIAIGLTFSRGGIFVWFLLLALAFWAKTLPRYAIAIFFALILIIPMAAIFIVSYVKDNPEYEGARQNIEQRIEFFDDLVHGKLPDEDFSSWERKTVLEAGLQTFDANPLFGAGACYTYIWGLPASTHNQPVRMLAEFGLIGGIVWVWMVYLIWRGTYLGSARLQMGAAGVFVALSFFSHNLFDSPQALVTLALLTQRAPTTSREARGQNFHRHSARRREVGPAAAS